jgi:hypothetical protein
MGHNFHVEWHFKFEVEIGENPWSIASVTIHKRKEKLKVGEQFMQNSLRKNPMSLCISCRG